MPQLIDFCSETFNGCTLELRTAIAEAEVPGLGEGPHNSSLAKLLSEPNVRLSHLPSDLAPRRQAECESGLWLLAGDIHRSHDISQDLPSAEGSFLHGIMHRREGDFGNSKYWFRKVGKHPLFQQIADETGAIYNDPFDFVDHCSAGESRSQCEEAQWIEWQLLMAYILQS